MNALQKFNQRQVEKLMTHKKPIPDFRPGDTLVVHVRIQDNEKERIQRFEGLCIARSNKGLTSSFLVRRVTGGFAVERVFQLYSPMIDKIECIRHGMVRRAKLFYIRNLSRKKSRIKERKA